MRVRDEDDERNRPKAAEIGRDNMSDAEETQRRVAPITLTVKEMQQLIEAIKASRCNGITCDGCALCDVLHKLYDAIDELRPLHP